MSPARNNPSQHTVATEVWSWLESCMDNYVVLRLWPRFTAATMRRLS